MLFLGIFSLNLLLGIWGCTLVARRDGTLRLSEAIFYSTLGLFGLPVIFSEWYRTKARQTVVWRKKI